MLSPCLCACLSILTPISHHIDLSYPYENVVSSPPLSLAHSSQPYFLHTAAPSYCPGYSNSQPHAGPRPHKHVGRESTDKHCTPQWTSADSNTDISSGFTYESLADVIVDSSHPYGNKFKLNIDSAYQYISDSKAKEHLDFGSDSIVNLDSVYCSYSETHTNKHKHNDSHTPVSGSTEVPGCTTPYKNIDAMMTYSNLLSAQDSLYTSSTEKHTYSHTASLTDHNSNKIRTSKALPPLPTCYLYHPKNCPLHRGAPPRLSPIGALSPPYRSGAPPPGVGDSCLSSPLFPRSHTLPALAAPLYYPNLYPPVPPRAPPLPPKLYQAPPQPRVPSKISLSLRSPCILHSDILLACSVCLTVVLSFHFCLCSPSRVVYFSLFNPGDLQI